jgi:hypothetical protein
VILQGGTLPPFGLHFKGVTPSVDTSEDVGDSSTVGHDNLDRPSDGVEIFKDF